MKIDHPANQTFVVCRNADGSVLHRITVGPDQSMATGQPVVEQTESEIEHVGHLAAFADSLPPLPAEGEPVERGQVYAYDGGSVMARQSHTRTHHAPGEVLALFVTHRPDAGFLEWIDAETVETGALREYEGAMYRAVQGHTTQTTWAPPLVPALWALIEVPSEDEPEPEPEPEPTTPEWEPGISVLAGEEYTYQGTTYRVIQAHTTQAGWAPTVEPALWEAV